MLSWRNCWYGEDKVIEFHNAYIFAQEKELDRLWKEEAPSTLIKFFPCKYETDGRNYFLDSLKNKTLWLSSTAFFNDPLDGLINFNCEEVAAKISRDVLNFLAGKEVAEKIFSSDIGRNKINRVASEFVKNISNTHNNWEKSIYSTCFSEAENLKSLRMWSYYANSHSGVCAEYEFVKVNNANPFGCIPIKYTDIYEYFINPTNNSQETIDFLKFYTKSAEWEYEKEWRVLQQVDENSLPGFNIPFSAPKRIYLGCRVGENLKNDILMLSDNIELYQMEIKPGTFCLEYERIN